MTIDDDSNNRGDDDGEATTDSIAGRILWDHVNALKPLVGNFEQIAIFLPSASRSTRAGLLEDAEDIARRVGNCGHDLARLLADLKRHDGG